MVNRIIDRIDLWRKRLKKCVIRLMIFLLNKVGIGIDILIGYICVKIGLRVENISN